MKMRLISLLKSIAERFPKIALTYRLVRDGWQAFDKPEETPLGFKFVGNRAMRQGAFEPEETEIVLRLLQSVDVFLNAGANIGYYCCIALSRNKPVVAFEPMALNLQCLLVNVKANNWESMLEAFPLALSNKVGIVEMYGSGTGASLVKGWAGTSEQNATLVPTSTLDIVLGARFQGRRCLILVDIEGAEKQMLEGASTFLCFEPKPIWMVEISVSEHQPQGTKVNANLLETFQIFWARGYEAWTANKQCRQVHPEELEAIVTSGNDTLHTHNFLFMEKGSQADLLGA
ncbi:MAG: FkbM family methyltransferase [Anaerolineales bacterium]|nr:FkbM family methyltransferase [Anaerolineales bacterium]